MVMGWPATSNWVVCTYGATTLFPSSSIATPNRVNPLSAYFFWKPIIQGISAWQGSHQVAQKFTMTTFPLRLARDTSLPCRSLKVTSGSSDKGFWVARLAAWLPLDLQPTKPAAAAASTITIRKDLHDTRMSTTPITEKTYSETRACRRAR